MERHGHGWRSQGRDGYGDQHCDKCWQAGVGFLRSCRQTTGLPGASHKDAQSAEQPGKESEKSRQRDEEAAKEFSAKSEIKAAASDPLARTIFGLGTNI